MSTLSIPNSFTGNTTALSAQVNANFAAVATFLNSTKINDDNIQDAGISGVKLANSTVDTGQIANSAITAAKIASDAVTTVKVLDANITLAKLAAAVQAALCPAGSILAWGGSATPPTGYLLCDGSAVSRSTYSALFAVVGEAHGEGDNSTTFNLPDYRGRFLRMVDGSAGVDPDKASRTAMATGGNTGNLVGSVQGFAMEAHTHNHVLGTGGGTTYSTGALNNGGVSQTSGTNTGTSSTETRPVNAYCYFIIKT